MTIRLIEPKDNVALSKLIPSVLTEFGAVGEGYACADPEVLDMFSAYQEGNTAYWVVEIGGKIVGGGGIGRLQEKEKNYCELQKMYFLPELRGKGVGKKLIVKALEFARTRGYSHCYLETLPNMKPAQALYKKFGFDYINNRMGNTGHSKCPVFMLLKL